ncbi:MAG TPA: AsmA-like C-terminal domain-containing protein [Methylomirabilota bacterium]|nr:AsmA-like C-terminal domain-containing protein [Methylomirabilota bacterium]
MNSVWRWFRLLLAIVAVVVVAGAAWVSWLISGQRYQQILAEQLSALLDAHVQMEKSHLSFHNGLGVQFDGVTIKDNAAVAPFFAAAEIDLLLDLSALWRGELLFHRIEVVQPRLQVTAEGKRFARLVRRLREAHGAGQGTLHWLTQSASPTLAVQELRLHGADIVYAKEPGGSTVQLVETEASLSFASPDKPFFMLRSHLKNKSGSIGQISVRAVTAQELNLEDLAQSDWTGELELYGVQLQQVGRALGEEWPPAKFDFLGRFTRQGTGVVELTGTVAANGVRVGEVQIHDAHLLLTKARWAGQRGAFLRALTVEAQIEQMHGEVGKDATSFTVTRGELTFHDEELTAVNLSGGYGKGSQFREAAVSLRNLFAKSGPAIAARIVAEVDLADGLFRLLTALTPAGSSGLSQTLTQPRGRALARFHVQRASGQSEPGYEGVVTLQDAGVRLAPWTLELNSINGELQLNANVLSTSALTFKVGESWAKAQGTIQDFLSPQRRVEAQLAFTDVRDHDVAFLFPTGKVLPQGGSLNGRLKVLTPAGGGAPEIDGQVSFTRVRLDLVDFLHPLEVIAGELTLAGKGGTFTVTQGQFPGGAFAGQGRIESWTPLRLELSGDFPELNLETALVLDKPDDGMPKDATRDVRATLTSKRLTYKGSHLENVQIFCHWHQRQADLRIARANVAGGEMQGEATLWPDLHSLYVAPQLKAVDVERLFRAVGAPTTALTGSLSSHGKIFMPNWAEWNELAQWDAVLSLKVEDGVAQRLPILVRLWSVLSMQGLLRLQLPSLPTEGLPFSSLTGDIAMGKGMAVTNNLVLNSSSVRIEASGQIDLAQRTLDLRTALVPLHGLTSSVAKVPVAGELLARGADYLTTLVFQVTGPFGDPSVAPLLVDTGG